MSVGRSAPRGAVFLSYASQDAEAAKRICDALRAAGIEVWFDQSELVGGDVWDQKIRKQIGSCALFVPIISAATQARAEGYFRLEWKLADRRMDLIGKSKAFLLPVCIDDTRDSEADVPDSFLTVQWTRLPAGETPSAFVARVRKLLDGDGGRGRQSSSSSSGVGIGDPALQPASRLSGAVTESGTPRPWPRARSLWIGGTLAVLAASYLLITFPRSPGTNPELARKSVGETPRNAAAPAAALDPKVADARALIAKAQPLHENLGGATRSDFELAGDMFKRALELAPLDAEVWAHYSWYCMNFSGVGLDRTPEREAEAKRAADRAFKLDSSSPMARMAWANYYRRQESTREEAIRVLAALADEHPQNSSILRIYALALDAAGRSEEARQAYERATATPGGDARAWAQLGDWHYRHNDPDAAWAAYQRSIEVKPVPRVLLGIARLQMSEQGDLLAAQQTLQRVPGEFMQEEQAIATAAGLALWQRRPEEVLRLLHPFPRDYLEGGNYRSYSGARASLVGMAQWLAGKPDLARLEWAEALRVIERRLETRRSVLELHWDRTLLLAMLGRKTEAEAALKLYQQVRFGSSVPANPASTPLKALVHAWSGELDAALAALGDIKVTPWLRYGPEWEPLRGDPRFQAVLARANVIPPGSGSPIPQILSAPNPPAPDAKSIAVLAFANLSDDKANEYFSDGISEELLNVLAKVPGLKVSARTSAFYFKGKDIPVPEIAKQLGVAYVVEGSVRKAGDKVRITAQLIKAADGFHVWSDTFTRDLKDVFAVQDEIAGIIAKNLSLKLGSGPSSPAVTMNPQAFEAYIQARQLWSRRTLPAFAQAEQLLNRALELDPGFTRARAALADVTLMRGYRELQFGNFEQRSSPAYERLFEQINAVLAADPHLAEAHATLGMVMQGKWAYPEAERALRRSIELNPNYATARQWLGMMLAGTGRIDEALVELKLATELDPLSFIILDNYGWILSLAGRHQEAVDYEDRALALNPGFDQTSFTKAMNLIDLGRRPEATDLVRQGQRWSLEDRIMVLARLGLTTEAEALLPGMAGRSPFNQFGALLALGRTKEALAALDVPPGTEGVSYGDTLALFYQPLYDSVRQHPRFVQLLQTLGVSELHARAQAWRQAHAPTKTEAKK